MENWGGGGVVVDKKNLGAVSENLFTYNFLL